VLWEKAYLNMGHRDKKSLSQRRYQDDKSKLEGRYMESEPRKRSR
jgi:hypothetical protein